MPLYRASYEVTLDRIKEHKLESYFKADGNLTFD